MPRIVRVGLVITERVRRAHEVAHLVVRVFDVLMRGALGPCFHARDVAARVVCHSKLTLRRVADDGESVFAVFELDLLPVDVADRAEHRALALLERREATGEAPVEREDLEAPVGPGRKVETLTAVKRRFTRS